MQLLARWGVTVVRCLNMKHDNILVLCVFYMAFYSVTTHLYLHIRVTLYLYLAYELWDQFTLFFIAF